MMNFAFVAWKIHQNQNAAERPSAEESEVPEHATIKYLPFCLGCYCVLRWSEKKKIRTTNENDDSANQCSVFFQASYDGANLTWKHR